MKTTGKESPEIQPNSSGVTRRQALRLAGVAGLVGVSRSILRAAPAGEIESIVPQGILIGECHLPGETRADGVFPAHPNGIPVSKNRWLLVYATRGFRGVDDDLSIIYQLRAGSPDGPVIKEGMLAKAISDWDPLGDGNNRHIKQHGHPVAFGVPRGAMVAGKPAPSANVFVVKWRNVAREYDPVRKVVLAPTNAELARRTQAVGWVQFRLNNAENDIEVIQPASFLRQKGYESGDQICGAGLHGLNETYVQATPYNREGTEWVDCCHFDGGHIACLKYKFNPKIGRYEWTDIGPILGGGKNHIPGTESWHTGIMEASLARWKDTWIIAARGGPRGGTTWFRTDDLFGQAPRPVNPDYPKINSPMTAYTWNDGKLRLSSGDAGDSSYQVTGSPGRNPLYCWDIDPDQNFRASRRRVIFDILAAKLPVRPESGPKADMCKLLPGWGRTQILVYRVSVRANDYRFEDLGGLSTKIPLVNAAEKAASAIYHSKITYSEAFPARWEFAS